MSPFRYRAFIVTIVIAAASTACSESSRLGPSGPTPVPAAVIDPDAIDDRSGVPADAHTVAVWAARTHWSVASSLTVEGEGTLTAVTPSCPTAVITMLDVPVNVNAATQFGGALSCASLAVGSEVKVRGVLTNNSGTLVVTATSIEPRAAKRRERGEGTVGSLTGTCPTLSMNVHGIRVQTTAATTFENGECGNLRPGTKVFIEGEAESDGSFTALSIRITDQPGGRPVEGEGSIGAIHGTCPTLTMVVHGYPVMLTSATTYTGGTCETLRPGTRIYAKGSVEGNSIVATEVEILTP
jgi:hypothetical protein